MFSLISGTHTHTQELKIDENMCEERKVSKQGRVGKTGQWRKRRNNILYLEYVFFHMQNPDLALHIHTIPHPSPNTGHENRVVTNKGKKGTLGKGQEEGRRMRR